MHQLVIDGNAYDTANNFVKRSKDKEVLKLSKDFLKAYAKNEKLIVKDGENDNPFFKPTHDQGELEEKYTKDLANLLLKNFDVNDLDMFEERQYNHYIKSMSKEEALQVLINTVEGDTSQLSECLVDIAVLQGKEY